MKNARMLVPMISKTFIYLMLGEGRFIYRVCTEKYQVWLFWFNKPFLLTTLCHHLALSNNDVVKKFLFKLGAYFNNTPTRSYENRDQLRRGLLLNVHWFQSIKKIQKIKS